MTAIHCTAPLHYVDRSTFEAAPVPTEIRDGRVGLADRAFEDCGFTLLDHASAVTDWRSEVHLDEVHGPEVAELAKAFTGCGITVTYPSLVRSPRAAELTEDYAPIDFVHSDFTEDYGRMVVEPDRPYRAFLDPLLDAQGLTPADLAAADRLMLLQFWRNTGPVEADYPFALCDARTIPESCMVRQVIPEYGGLHLEFETFGVWTPSGDVSPEWYTFPNLGIDEVVALRTYDSRCVDQGRPFWTPHSAFRDPGVEASPQTRRESVEMRVLCVWPS
ncbi:MAG: CmcJ/NvfI family oxidoreductase [Actinomycetota bacterium]